MDFKQIIKHINFSIDEERISIKKALKHNEFNLIKLHEGRLEGLKKALNIIKKLNKKEY